jgi:hypothetical protein
MATLSNYALEAMGYKTLDPGEKLTAKFTRVDVFALQGISLNEPYSLPVADSINGVPFKMGFGSSLNEVCMQLVGDDFVEDEEQWKKDTQSIPPFLLLSFGPTSEHVSATAYCNEIEGKIVTYDSFAEAQEELRTQFDAVVPALLTSLSLSFRSEGRTVRFLHRTAAVVGETLGGKKVIDWRLKVNGEAFVSTGITEEKVVQLSASALKTAKTLDKEISKFFFQASAEKDPLKRFLNFFFCLERLVHSTFSNIDHQAAVSSLLVGHPSIAESGQKLLAGHRDSWKDLRNKFIWCAMHEWPHLTDADVEQFERLKYVRDRISHGKLSAPDAAAVADIEKLALHILGSP